MAFSTKYIAHLSAGPFPNRIDPWVEDDHYFSQLHSGIIAGLLAQLWQPLLMQGYHVSKEASLQISEMRKPDIAIRQRIVQPETTPLDYAAAAAAILAEPGENVEWNEPEFQALHIKESGTNQLVTVVEIISPRNKTHWADMTRYRDARENLFLKNGVYVVEIDLTRSIKRLFDHPLTRLCAYHAAILMPDKSARVIKLQYDEPLKRCALPLKQEVIGVELQEAYTHAYQEATLAPQMLDDGHYALEMLPFPSLLTEQQQHAAQIAVSDWHSALQRLRQESDAQ